MAQKQISSFPLNEKFSGLSGHVSNYAYNPQLAFYRYGTGTVLGKYLLTYLLDTFCEFSCIWNILYQILSRLWWAAAQSQPSFLPWAVDRAANLNATRYQDD